MILNRAVLGLLAFAVGFIQCDDWNPDLKAEVEAAQVSSVLFAPVPTPTNVVDFHKEYTAANEAKAICHNYRTEFNKNLRGWQVENSMQDTYDIDTNGVQLNLVAPKQYIRLFDKATDLPFNKLGGRGPTLNSTAYMRFGRLSATLKSAGAGGSVTAFILMADGGDEIDFEFLGGDTNHVQTNYFWGTRKEYTVNGGLHKITGGPVDTSFHKYTIDWMPDKIEWLVDDKLVRTKTKAETCDTTGLCKFPSQPARVQFGLWDGSIEPGTAEWSRGPIDWALPQSISAHIRDVTVDCHPEYNQIVD